MLFEELDVYIYIISAIFINLFQRVLLFLNGLFNNYYLVILIFYCLTEMDFSII